MLVDFFDVIRYAQSDHAADIIISAQKVGRVCGSSVLFAIATMVPAPSIFNSKIDHRMDRAILYETPTFKRCIKLLVWYIV